MRAWLVPMAVSGTLGAETAPDAVSSEKPGGSGSRAPNFTVPGAFVTLTAPRNEDPVRARNVVRPSPTEKPCPIPFAKVKSPDAAVRLTESETEIPYVPTPPSADVCEQVSAPSGSGPVQFGAP